MNATQEYSYVTKNRKYSTKEIEDYFKTIVNETTDIFCSSNQPWSLKGVIEANDYYFAISTKILVDKNLWYGPDYKDLYLNVVFKTHSRYYTHDKNQKQWVICALTKGNGFNTQKANKPNTGDCDGFLSLYKNMDYSLDEIIEKVKKSQQHRLNQLQQIELADSIFIKSNKIATIGFADDIQAWAEENGFEYSASNYDDGLNRWNVGKGSGKNRLTFNISQMQVKKYNKVFVKFDIYYSRITFNNSYYFKNDDIEGIIKTLETFKNIFELPPTDYHELL